MIGRSFRRKNAAKEPEEAKGFDAYELRLGDLMRGERATMGKSLLDVQRELKIKAAYIAAIENADPSAFDTPGFIAGYVRSYAKYLQMDPEWAFETFCRESGFTTAHGLSKDASSPKKVSREERLGARTSDDIFDEPTTPFIPSGESIFARIEPGAIGSLAVLAGLLAGLGYGGWSVLQEVQKVRFAPVEQPPVVIADVDPLAGNGNFGSDMTETVAAVGPTVEAMTRILRPEALEAPVLTPRDGPIAALQPGALGALAPQDLPEVDAVTAALAEASGLEVQPSAVPAPQVTTSEIPEIALVAVRPSWVRITASDGTILFQDILDSGSVYSMPQKDIPPTVRVGESGAVYFRIGDEHYGPAGDPGQVTSNLAMSADFLTERYELADPQQDNDLAVMVNVADASQ